MRTALDTYIILYRFQAEGEKKPGPVRQFRICAENLADARRQAERYANYPNIRVIDIHPA